MTKTTRRHRMTNFIARIGRVLARALASLWRGLDQVRRALLNLLVLAVLALLVASLFWDGNVRIPDTTAVVLTPRGKLVEELSVVPLEALAFPTPERGSETLLRDTIETITRAAKDDRVEVLVLELGELHDSGLSKLQEVASAIDTFKAADKRVIATADQYSQAAYYLAAHADEVYVHPMGQIVLEGFGDYHLYFKEALDRLQIEANVFRVGTYKSAVEPLLSTQMSPEAREANLAWMHDLWNEYIDGVALARGLAQADIFDYAEHFDTKLSLAQGDAAVAAREAGLVDDLRTRDQVRERVSELVGADKKTGSFVQVAGPVYLDRARQLDSLAHLRHPTIAVVVARGTIMDGRQPPGTIGGDSTAARIRRARLDDNVRAVVLRVDSGGGSAFASEVIRRELEITRDAGKPVVVSMSSVAASGGYWIACASDEIWASPTTITGSIGIFGLFPTFERSLENLGIRSDGISMTTMGGARPERSLDPPAASVLQAGIERGYERFVQTVATARNMDREAVDKVAQGRVWSGQDAYEHGLIDHLGGLEDAIAAAARRAELGDEFRVTTIDPERSWHERLMTRLLDAGVVEPPTPSTFAGPYLSLPATVAEEARLLASLNDPRGQYAHSLIATD